MRAAFAFIAAGLLAPAWAQFTVHGRVVDSRTSEPLAFVHVLPAMGDGATTDIDGRFVVPVSGLPVALRFSYVGYAPLAMEVDGEDAGIVRMERMAIALAEAVVVPGENPAHRIIERVHANRRINDGLRHRAHRYTSYSKTVLTGAVDSALLADPERLAALDSNDREAVDFFGKQHLLLIESATRKAFIPPADEKEEVLAMRVSGLQDPSLLALAASTKTFSIYEPQIRINEKAYLSPISPNSTDRYLFMLEDTLLQGRDSVFVISYRPRSGRTFEALKGVLWVSTDGYALQNVIAEPVERSGGTGIKLQQRFQRFGDTWFPVQLNTFLYLDQVKMSSFAVQGIGRTYLRDIEVDAPIARKEVRGAELVMERMAVQRDDAFWESVRADTLAPKERRTYHAIDSLSRAEGIEQRVKWFERLATGRLPVGPIDLRLDQLMRYNGYEGFRLGLGAATNDRLTRHASLGGYLAYGFQDETFKHGADLTLKPRPGRGGELRLYCDLDVTESGGVAFPGARSALLDPEGYRWLYVDRMDLQERFGAELAWRISSALRIWVGTERIDRENLLGYQLAEPAGESVTLLSDHFLVGAYTLGARFAFREQVAQLPGRQIALPSRWPVLHVRAMQAARGLWEGDRSFWRLDAMVEKSIKLRMAGELGFRLMAGLAQDDAPYSWLYNLRGTNLPRLPLAGRNTFETMRPNEFLADRYAAVHLRHSFGNLLYKGRKWRPVPIVVANAAWGGLARPERHRGLPFTPLEQGYYEAGLQVDQVLRSGFTGFGVAAFCRLGPNSLPEPLDNLAVKLSLGLVL